MGLYWNPYAAAGTGVLLIGWALAAFVYFANPARLQNRLLSLAIVLEASSIGIGTGIMFFFDDARSIVAWQGVNLALFIPSNAVYLCFLGTLDTPLVAPLRRRTVRWALAGAAVVGAAGVALNLDSFVSGAEPTPYARLDATFTQLGILFFILVPIPAAVWSLAASISNLRRSQPGTAGRARARAYFTAFLVNDLQGLNFTAVFLVATFFPSQVYQAINVGLITAYIVGPLFGGLLTYGILKTQLFDIDLKLKFAIKGSTLAALFVGAFFVVDQLVQALAGQAFGAVAGAVAAGLLLFALQPLHRFATHVSDRALPRADGSADYLAFRKMEVYKEAVEALALDGGLSTRERHALDRLRAILGIAEGAATALERAVVAA